MDLESAQSTKRDPSQVQPCPANPCVARPSRVNREGFTWCLSTFTASTHEGEQPSHGAWSKSSLVPSLLLPLLLPSLCHHHDFLAQVTADGGGNFVLHHRETGETLEIFPVFLPDGGTGLPGNADAGAMQIASYVQPRQRRRRQQRQPQKKGEPGPQSKDQQPHTEGPGSTEGDLHEELTQEVGTEPPPPAAAARALAGRGSTSLPHQQERPAETRKGARTVEEIGALQGGEIDGGVADVRFLVSQDEEMELGGSGGLATTRGAGEKAEIEAEYTAVAAEETVEETPREGQEVEEGAGEGMPEDPEAEGEELREEAEGMREGHGGGEHGAEGGGEVGGDSDKRDRQRQNAGRSDGRARARGSLSRNTVLVTKEVRCTMGVCSTYRTMSSRT